MLKLKLFILFLFSSIAAFSSGFSEQSIEEFTVKGVMLEKFSRFIEWPDNPDNKDFSKPFIICVYNDTRLANVLSKIYKSQKINNRFVIIRNVTSINEIENCNILYIPHSAKANIKQILAYTHNKSILTVSDTDGWAQLGVIVNFFVKDSKIGFEINEEALHDSKLYIGFRLLSAAIIVKTINE